MMTQVIITLKKFNVRKYIENMVKGFTLWIDVPHSIDVWSICFISMHSKSNMQ